MSVVTVPVLASEEPRRRWTPLDVSGVECAGTLSDEERAGLHAVGLVLEHCLALGRPRWAWSVDEWAGLLGASAEAFLAERSLPTETTVRPLAVDFAYLLAGFDRLDQLGTYNRLHLAKLVFGAGAAETSITEVTTTLDARRGRSRGKFSTWANGFAR